MDFQAFYAGKAFDAADFLGAHVAENGVTFRVFAPSARAVSLIGEWNGWQGQPMEKIYDGNFYACTVPEAKSGMMYKYKIFGADGSEVDHCDPYGYGMELRPASASIIRDLSDYTFHDDAWVRGRNNRLCAPLNIYEVHLGSWKSNPDDPNGWFTYDAIAPELIEYVKENGYNYIELMPICEHPCDSSWGYQNTGYFSPTSRYGTAQQLMRLIDLCHQAGIGVLLDFVPVHFALDDYGLARFDGTNLYEYPHPDVGVSEWGSCNFMHSRGEVRSFLQSSAWFWLEKFHFDGLRMDAISRILYWQGDENRGVNRDGEAFLRVMNAGLKQRCPGCMLIAEDSTQYPGVTHPVEAGGLGFDYKWDMGWMNDTLDFFRTPPEKRSKHYHKLTFSMLYFPRETYLLPLSHDENVHGKATILQKMYGDYEDKFPQARALYLYMMMHPGKKLNFMGSEFGQLREWDETREQDWEILRFPIHDAFHRYIRKLNALYQENAALWQGDYTPEGFEWLDCHAETSCIYAFARRKEGEQLITVLNLSDTAHGAYRLKTGSTAPLTLLLNTDWQTWGGASKQEEIVLHPDENGTVRIDLPRYTGILLRQSVTPDKKR